MRPEETIFARRSPRTAALAPFGFVRDGDGYVYREPFFDGAFCAEVRVGRDGALTASAIDTETGEAYLPVWQETNLGGYAAAVREAYETVLRRVAAACFTADPFFGAQANRLAHRVREEFGEEPDFPFSASPGAGVFRCPRSRKWYGLVMRVPRGRLTGETAPVGERPTEILNLHAEAAAHAAARRQPGIYAAYHMKHASWLSILLDDTVPDEVIWTLLTESRAWAAAAGGRAPVRGEDWIIPANPAYYDIDADIAATGGIYWKQSRGMRLGDTVYIYVGAPVSSVRYRCVIEAENILEPGAADGGETPRVMRLRCVREYPQGMIGLARLRALGVQAVRGARRTGEAFSRAMREL